MVSILVPIYNVAPFIERCSRSLFEQSYHDIEYIFVDDDSPDNSVDILRNTLKDYPDRMNAVKIISHPSNKGLAGARNTAVDNATGDYVLHVDSDDWLETDAVELLMNTAMRENADIVYSDFKEIRQDGTNILRNPDISDSRQYTKSLLCRKSLTHVIGKLIKRSIIVENDIRAIEGLNQGEDYLITPKLAYHSKKVFKSANPIYNYNRLNISSYTANVNDKGIDMVIRVQQHLVDYFSDLPDADDFKTTIMKSCIYNKLTCFYCGPFSSYKKISELYRDIDWKKLDLSMKQKLVLFLSDARQLNLLHRLISFANKKV
ncbi:MAG: glycosyltransferase family 2 protein [Bacteroidales bacterium]|nr:glycosyltransferase family 2 protein [Bacteroidales bacterium]